jgi:hypothetical protein
MSDSHGQDDQGPRRPASPRTRPAPTRRTGGGGGGPGRRPSSAGRTGKVVAIGLAMLVVVLVLGQVVIADDHGGGSAGSTDAGSTLPSYGTDWHTIDGSSYRISVVPSSEPIDEASPGHCVPAPGVGRANLGFTVRIDNLGAAAAPMPEVLFAVTADAAGSLDTSPEVMAGTNRSIEVLPAAKGHGCDEASTIRPTGRGRLRKGGSASFTGIVGPIVAPVPEGLSLIVRYVQTDPTHPRQASTAEVLAPFPTGIAHGG